MSEGRYFPAAFLQRNDALHDRRDEMERDEVVEHLQAMVAASINGKDIDALQVAASLLENRWSGFDDEEMRALRAGAAELMKNESMSIRSRNIATDVSSELIREMIRREAERSDYRGPGIYRHVGGNEMEVLGKTQEHVIMRSTNGGPGDLLAVPLTTFDDRIGTEPRYTWVREA